MGQGPERVVATPYRGPSLEFVCSWVDRWEVGRGHEIAKLDLGIVACFRDAGRYHIEERRVRHA